MTCDRARQKAKLSSFPTAQSAGRYAIAQEEIMDQGRRMPFGLCLMIWAAIAVAGWGVFGVARQTDLTFARRFQLA